MVENLLLSLGLSGLIAGLAYWRGSLSPSGAGAALLVGTLTFGFGGWRWGILLGLFFVSSSLLSHYKENEKQAAAEKFEKGHQRDWGQVLANGGLGSLVAVVSVFAPSEGWFVLFVGIMATVTADTWATELGTLSKRPPRLITTGEEVEVGSSGGISFLGTLVSLAGGLAIGLAAGILDPTLELALGALIGALGGLTGSLIDSFLGATAQQINYCDSCLKETERKKHKCGQETRTLRGWNWLNNDLVNLISSLIGGMVALTSWQLFL